MAFLKRVAQELKWKVSHVSERGLVIHTPFSVRYGYRELVAEISEQNSVRIYCVACKSQVKSYSAVEESLTQFVSCANELKQQSWYNNIPSIDAPSVSIKAKFHKNAFKEQNGIEQFLGLLSITKSYKVAPILVYVNMLIFLLMGIESGYFNQPFILQLIDWGGNYRPMTLDFGFWRLLSSVFVHVDVFHLLGNMIALLYVGSALEKQIGSKRLTMVYLICGVLASCTSLAYHPSTVAIGASGAIFGLYGLFLVLLLQKKVEKINKTGHLLIVSYFIVYHLAPTAEELPIDHAAHWGGAITGVVLGIIGVKIKKYKMNLEHYVAHLLFALIVFSCTIIFTPKDTMFYRRAVLKILNTNELADWLLKDRGSISEYRIQERLQVIITHWEKGLEEAQQLVELELPETYHSNVSSWEKYCQLKLASYQLELYMLEHNTDVYKISLASKRDSADRLLYQMRFIP